ncbi:MAG: hypothetical protein OIF32_00610 [Campylobacterales bacterium]|nr:hypothetical protein [Campylobacterales bacterium]
MKNKRFKNTCLLLCFFGVSLLNAEESQFSNDIVSPSLPEGTKIMKNFCTNPKSEETYGNKFSATCNWCPRESTKRNGSLELSSMIKGDFLEKNEVLINSYSCEQYSAGYSRDSAVLLNLDTSEFRYFKSAPPMGRGCVKFENSSNKTTLVCSESSGGYGERYGRISHYTLSEKGWKESLLMKTMDVGSFAIYLKGLEKIKEEGLFSDSQQLIIHLEVGNPNHNELKNYKLEYSLEEDKFVINDNSKEIKIKILSERP